MAHETFALNECSMQDIYLLLMTVTCNQFALHEFTVSCTPKQLMSLGKLLQLPLETCRAVVHCTQARVKL